MTVAISYIGETARTLFSVAWKSIKESLDWAIHLIKQEQNTPLILDTLDGIMPLLINFETHYWLRKSNNPYGV